MIKTIDLHCHTTHSDGSMTPRELIYQAKKENLSAIAITDHDCIAGIDEAIKLGKENDIEIIPGVEFNCLYNEGEKERELHVLGLGIDYKNKKLSERIKTLHQEKERRSKEILSILNSKGINLSYEEVSRIVNKEKILRIDIAIALMKKGYTASIGEGFRSYLGHDNFSYSKSENMSFEEVIDLIKTSGGVSILAHPTLYPGLRGLSYKKIDTTIKKLKSLGLNGIEVFHSYLSNKDKIFLFEIAKQNNLLITGGSDYHGLNKTDVNLGSGVKNNLSISYEYLKTLKEFISINKNSTT